jgi:L-lactate dehydrogenase complex protein LldG
VSPAREAILARIRTALADVPRREEISVPRDYRERGALPAAERLQLFVERLEDYGASVVVTDEPGAAGRAPPRRG